MIYPSDATGDTDLQLCFWRGLDVRPGALVYGNGDRRVFERYTEKARKVIFFSRYEASQFGSRHIETEHLLLGLLREDATLRIRLGEVSSDELGSVRKQVESQTAVGKKISTSVDVPLSLQLKRVLAYASDEAASLQHPVIDSGHLVLGLLRTSECLGAALLQQRGINYEDYREVVRTASVALHSASRRLASPRQRAAERPSAWQELDREPAAISLRAAVAGMQGLVDQAIEHLDLCSPAYGDQRLRRSPWSRKEALGHLIDLATAHHQWFARALTEPKLSVSAYPQDEWVRAQQYQNASWPDMVDLWISLNRLVVHLLTLIPEEKLNMSCRIGMEEPISLLKVIVRYVERCGDSMGQILSRL